MSTATERDSFVAATGFPARLFRMSNKVTARPKTLCAFIGEVTGTGPTRNGPMIARAASTTPDRISAATAVMRIVLVSNIPVYVH